MRLTWYTQAQPAQSGTTGIAPPRFIRDNREHISKLRRFAVARNLPSNPLSRALLPTLNALMIMETILVATLRAHFGFKDESLTKRLHMPDDRVLDG
jgi:hypothetical protein